MPELPPLSAVFSALPDAYLLLSTELIIEAASNAYLAATLTQRESLLGKSLFEVFPDNPGTPEAYSTHNLRASLNQVLATGKPHQMARQRYDVPSPQHAGQFVERYWLPCNTPILDEQGQVTHILHAVVNITEQMQDEARLRASQLREKEALAEAEAHRHQLQALLLQAPALIASLRGPDHVVELVNEGFRQMFGGRAMEGKPYREAVPELQDQPFFDLLDEVYRTGETYYGNEVLAYIKRTNSDQREALHFNFIYQATRDAVGSITGILIFAYNVEDQVRARQQVQHLNQDLAAANEALEKRVSERTQALQQAQADAEQQRARLESLFMQAPAAICILDGPDLVYGLVNPSYQQLFPGRQLLGQPILQALPEIANHQVYHTFRRVYDTGVTQQELGTLIPLARPTDGILEDRYFNYIQQARYNADGFVDGIIVFAFEVTEQVMARQQAEKAQQNSESTARQLQLLTDALPVLIGYVDQNRTYQFANRAYENWFKMAPDELVGRAVQDVLGDEAYARVAGYIERALAGERLTFNATMPYRENFSRHIHTSYIPDVREGKVVGFYSLVADVTEQVQTQQQVQELNEALAAINKELQASNQEISSNHAELIRTQQALLDAAQHQIQQRETFYQVFEQTPASIGLLRGPEHRFEYINEAYQQLFPNRELLGRPVAEALPETVEQGFLALIDNVYRTGETFFGTELRLSLANPDGTQPNQDVYFTFTYQAYRENGVIIGVSIFAYDVTEQVLARQEREAERQRLENLFMQAPAPITILDGPDLVYQLVNPAYQLIFPGRELLHKPLLVALPELADSPIPQLLRQVYTTGETYVAQEMPLMLARNAGAPLEEIFWTFTYQARRNAQGAVDGVMCFAHEVTDQVQARRVVEEREQSFRQMADSAPAMLWVTDANGYCTYLNYPWYAYTGQTEAQALGMGWTEAVHPDDAAATGAAFIEATAKQLPFHCQYRLRRHDGTYRWATDSGLPRFGASGEFEGIVGTVIDVHEQKLAELALQRLTQKLRTSRDEAQALNAELRETNEQLVRTNVDLDNFIYTASHDLKAPISNIEGLLHMLQDELPLPSKAGEVPHILDLMQESVDRFTRTIEHLTDISKLQKEHSQPVVPVPLAAVLEDVCLDLAPLLQQVGGRISAHIDATPTVNFSEKNLRSVVYNLLSNALKYHHPDRPPEVQVRSRVEAAYHVLEVQDNGLGLDLTREKSLFAMFRRYHTHVEGSGIGLYMVKKMVENTGGKIEVESQVGSGSTFSVYFPI
ncbi:PAS domain-containing sensor histidine kinase [Hymenobacter sediminicola]|uniref:histidine kinase n=1 Tax=Hymenobacter sediminicola TaxID=2761579 RepID=A0A7G7W3I2_9BACT|nr:PAS domain-containing protein [Hymenobacter sediminicola]QNH60925.1 PAS domain-containing protein [Hymenobacter sediminicola]